MASASRINILIVVVRYKTPIEHSQTLDSLSVAFSSRRELLEEFSVLLWDNSPVRLEDPQLTFPFEYAFSETNLGVSGAYNLAAARAESKVCRWLLLLDQDTTVTVDYLERMQTHVRGVDNDETIATVVPFVRSNGDLVSPRKFGQLLRNQQIARSVSGRYQGDAYAVNSGTFMRVSALREAGGYSNEFWLDLSDVYVFQALYRHGKRMYIAGDVELEHSIASMDFDRQMTPERYRSFLAAENLYLALYRSPLANLLQSFWLVARAARQYRRYKNKAFSKITLSFFWQRTFRSESACVKEWRGLLESLRSIPAISEGKIVG